MEEGGPALEERGSGVSRTRARLWRLAPAGRPSFFRCQSLSMHENLVLTCTLAFRSDFTVRREFRPDPAAGNRTQVPCANWAVMVAVHAPPAGGKVLAALSANYYSLRRHVRSWATTSVAVSSQQQPQRLALHVHVVTSLPVF